MKSKSWFCALIVFILLSCGDSGKGSRYYGFYHIDLYESELGIYLKDSTTFKNLTLNINPDQTFSFNMDVPFINCKWGKWKIKSIDGFDGLYLVYGKAINVDIEEEVNLTVEHNIYFNNTRSKFGSINVKKLCFNRISH